MSKLAIILVALPCAVAWSALSARAASESGFNAALAAATQAEQQAGAIHNQWIPTENAIKAAKKAADAKDYDKAVTLARQAEALAKRSIEQAREQDKAWHNAVIR